MQFLRKSIGVWALLLLVPVLASGQDPDPFEPDTIRVVSVETDPGVAVALPITCWNDEDLGGFSLGFHWSSSDITVDSISFVGGRVPATAFTQVVVENANQLVLIGMVDFTFMNPLLPGDGMIFNIWYNVPGGTMDQFVDIDSSFVPPAGTFTLSPVSGGSVTPQFLGGTIKIGDPQPPPEIVLSPTSFVFNAQVGGGNPTSQVLNIANGGGQTLDWEASWSESWLGVSPDQGTAPSTVVITANIAGLSAGTYADVVTVSAAGATNTPQTFSVTLNLTVPPPTISVTPSSFYFQALQDSAAPAPQDMNIENVGQGTLNWTATESVGWLSLSSYSGTAPSVVTLTPDNTGLTAGVYSTQITISDPTATNSPQMVPVTFEIFSAFPVLNPDPDSIIAVASSSSNPYDRLLLLKNDGGGVMDWSVTKTKPWLSMDIDTGTSVQGSPTGVTLSFDRTQVGFGIHRDTITVSSTNATNSPIKIPVVFWKAEVPQTLNVSTNSLSFSTVECGTFPAVQPQYFNITASQVSPPLDWTLTYSAPWLSATPTGAAMNQTVTVSVQPTGLAPGVYEDTITIFSQYSINPPRKVAVTYTVVTSPPNPNLVADADTLKYFFRWTLVGASDKEVTMYADIGGCVDWQATPTVSWLSAVPDTGTTLDTAVIRGDAVGLALGRYTGGVIFTSNSAANTPFTVPAVLWVYTLGDANGDAIINISDVVYIIEYIFAGGPAPIPLPFVGDVDCSHRTNISDAVHLIDWIFNGGPPPCVY